MFFVVQVMLSLTLQATLLTPNSKNICERLLLSIIIPCYIFQVSLK